MLMNGPAKKKGFAKLFCFASPNLFPHSPTQVFFFFSPHKEGRSEVGNSSMPGNNKHFKGDVCLGFHNLISMKALNPLDGQGIEMHTYFSSTF